MNKQKIKKQQRASKLFRKAIRKIENHPQAKQLMDKFGAFHINKYGKSIMEGYYKYGLFKFVN